MMRFGMAARGPLSRPGREALPCNRGLPLVYRFLREARAEPAVEGPRGRDEALAAVEAALFAADEPLSPRRLAQAAGLNDGGEARRLVRRLSAFYDEDGSAFQVEEVA